MIRLNEKQYAAIGRVAVQSGTLDRELGEYLVRLRAPKYKPDLPLGTKLERLQTLLRATTALQVALPEFEFALSTIVSLIRRRNAVAHGTWSDVGNAPTSLGDVSVAHKGTTLHAREILDVAQRLRIARKLLLRLFHDHLPVAAGSKKCPKKSVAALKQEL